MSLSKISMQWLLPLLGMGMAISGCQPAAPQVSKQMLSLRSQELLGAQQAVAVQAEQLTDVTWQKLCFQRGQRLHLDFHNAGRRQRVSLPYEEFFVDEAHVQNALDGVCVMPQERIILRRMYPGRSGPLVFQAASPETPPH